MSSYSADEGIIDVEKRTKAVETILGDPTLFPIEFLSWLKRYIEQSGIMLPASAIFGTFTAGAGSVRTLSPGIILPWATSTPPAGALACDGTAVSRVTYAALFGVIGTIWGPGDGSNTFNLPDLRGRIPVGLGTNADVDAIGDSDGLALASRTPKHSHGGNTGSASPGTDAQGSHSHGGGTDSAGSHTHTTSGSLSNTSVSGPGAYGVAANNHTHEISTDGGHTHSISTDSQGGHSHTVNAHGHSIPTDQPAFATVLYVITTG